MSLDTVKWTLFIGGCFLIFVGNIRRRITMEKKRIRLTPRTQYLYSSDERDPPGSDYVVLDVRKSHLKPGGCVLLGIGVLVLVVWLLFFLGMVTFS